MFLAQQFGNKPICSLIVVYENDVQAYGINPNNLKWYDKSRLYLDYQFCKENTVYEISEQEALNLIKSWGGTLDNLPESWNL